MGRVLIVDDEPAVRSFCLKALAELGLEAEGAASGDEAWRLYQAGSFDLVLTDIHMPGEFDGARLVAEIKQRSPSSDVIIMTGLPELETAVATLKSGAHDYLIKPFNLDFLNSVVRRCLEKRSLAEELSREKIMRAELEAAYSELQKVERLKEAILARVHHELRTPITVALLAAEFLSSEPLSEAGRRHCRTLRERIGGLKEIIENVLLFSDLRQSGFALTRTAVDLKPLLAEIVEKFRPLWEDRRLVVSVSSAPGLEPLELDASLMKSACAHLLLNAIHFSRTGGKIAVSAERRGETAVLSFSDTGIGFPSDRRNRLADGFYQAAEHMTRKVGGLGLGLAIVRRIAEAHGGTISVSGREGEGSVFTLSLPAPGGEKNGTYA